MLSLQLISTFSGTVYDAHAVLPNYFLSLPHWDRQAQVWFGKSPMLAHSNTLLLHTSLGSGTIVLNYLVVWPHQDDLCPAPKETEMALINLHHF